MPLMFVVGNVWMISMLHIYYIEGKKNIQVRIGSVVLYIYIYNRNKLFTLESVFYGQDSLHIRNMILRISKIL